MRQKHCGKVDKPEQTRQSQQLKAWSAGLPAKPHGASVYRQVLGEASRMRLCGNRIECAKLRPCFACGCPLNAEKLYSRLHTANWPIGIAAMRLLKPRSGLTYFVFLKLSIFFVSLSTQYSAAPPRTSSLALMTRTQVLRLFSFAKSMLSFKTPFLLYKP